MSDFELAWVRTRVLADAKKRAHHVAHLLQWNVTGVEAALLNYMLTEYEPEILADFILSGLEVSDDGPNPDRSG
jgi:hypothetical protein